jgi:hypothetical protein
MPVSRSRKKKKTNTQMPKAKTTASTAPNSHALANPDLWHYCGDKVEKTNFEDISDEEKQYWNESEHSGEVLYFRYCPTCENRSAVLAAEEV